MSVGPLVRIAYHVPGMERRRQVVVAGDGHCAGGNDARELGVVVRGNDEVRRISVSPVVPVIIDEVVATMRIDVCSADAIYLNGYNSWTDSIERPPMGRMWGLTRAPGSIVERLALDAAGDYRFCAEDARPGHQHGFGYGYLRQEDEVLLFGSLDEDSGMTMIREDAEEGTLTFDKEPPARIICAHETVEVLSLALLGGTLDDAVSRYLALSGVRARNARPLVGYASWYRHFQDIDASTLYQDLLGACSVLEGEDLEGCEPLFLVGDGYARVGDWLDVDESRFPDGLGVLASATLTHGMTPGLWLAPFLCERDSRLFVEHPEWLLRDERGTLVCASSRWSGAYALDTRMSEVRDYIARVLHTVTRKWGFELLRLDYLFAASMEVRDGMNRGELMADAIDLIRSSVPDSTRLLLSGVPIMSAIGKCEYCQAGPDASLTWDDAPHMRLMQRERPSTKNSLANARGRAHLSGKAFFCDPGPLFLREDDVALSASQRVEMFVTTTSCGGVLITSDEMGAWDDTQRQRYHEAMQRFRKACGLA